MPDENYVGDRLVGSFQSGYTDRVSRQHRVVESKRMAKVSEVTTMSEEMEAPTPSAKISTTKKQDNKEKAKENELISFVFLALCAWPSHSITQRFFSFSFSLSSVSFHLRVKTEISSAHCSGLLGFGSYGSAASIGSARPSMSISVVSNGIARAHTHTRTDAEQRKARKETRCWR